MVKSHIRLVIFDQTIQIRHPRQQLYLLLLGKPDTADEPTRTLKSANGDPFTHITGTELNNRRIP